MRVKLYAQGKFYTIQCPEGTRVVRRPERTPDDESVSHDLLVIPLNGKEIRIPAEPPELLPMLAESGNFGVSLVPDVRLAGASCPGCGEDHVAWLRPEEGSESVHCDHCGTDFELPVRHITSVPATDST